MNGCCVCNKSVELPETITLDSLNRLSADDKIINLEKYHDWLDRQRHQDKDELERNICRKYRFKVAKKKILFYKTIYLGDDIMFNFRAVVINSGEVKEYLNIYEISDEQIEKRKEYGKKWYRKNIKRK